MARSIQSRGSDWTGDENRAIVDAYIDMLLRELRSQPVNKRAINQMLRDGPLATRSRGSVEFKFQNISAVMNARGLRWVKGYKPRGNVQGGLEMVVEEQVLKLQLDDRVLLEAGAKDAVLQAVKDRLSRSALLAGIQALRDKPSEFVTPSTHYDVAYAGERFPPLEVLREAARVALGVDLGQMRGGQGTLAFRILTRAGLSVLPKEEVQRPDEAEMDREVDRAADQGAFDPSNDEDARRRMTRTIAARRGQPEFRALLIEVYEGRCAFTSCDAEPALEAAHIMAYQGDHTNHVQNGLLLRADVHTLFDRGLMGVNPERLSILLSPSLRPTSYASFEHVPVRHPDDEALAPSREALEQHARVHKLV